MRIRKWIYTTLFLAGFAALMPGFLRSQQGDAPRAETAAAFGENADSFDQEDLPIFVIRSEVSMVSVPVTVRKADGSLLKGLTQKSFKVLEDGKEQEIVFFAEEALPTHIAIVLDISGSVRPEWGAIKYATKRFLENFSPDDDFSLTIFNDEIKLIMDWGKTTDPVDAKLSSVYCKDTTKLWDAVWLVSMEVFKGLDGKKVMIIMSDGLDNDSLASYTDAVRAAVENEIAIYIVSTTKALNNYYDYVIPQMGYNRNDFMYRLQRELVQGEAMLSRLAHATGGRVLQSNDFGQLGNVYAEVSEELRNQYTVGYISTNTAKDGSYREINVGVRTQDAQNVMITARPGYYAPRK